MAEQELEFKKLTIVIAGRSFPVKVTKEEALILPNLEKTLNDQIRQVQLSYADRDIQDCLSMVLLTQALANQNQAPAIIPDLTEKVDKLNLEIESALV